MANRRTRRLNWQHFSVPKYDISETATSSPIDCPHRDRTQSAQQIPEVSPRTNSAILAPVQHHNGDNDGNDMGSESYDGSTALFKTEIEPFLSQSKRNAITYGDEFGSYAPPISFNEEWNAEALLAFTQEVRRTLTNEVLSEEDVKALEDTLDDLLKSEKEDNRVDIHTVVNGRLDKLLEDIIRTDKEFFPCGTRSAAMIKKAVELRSRWQFRFGNKYSGIDVGRLEKLQRSGGDLHNVAAYLENGHTKWRIDMCHATTTLIPGRWWPNVACLIRDGILPDNFEEVTELPSGILVLPMLTGVEIKVDNSHEGRSKLVKKGTLKQVHIGLMTVKGPIKLLRGHDLESPYAPEAGIRFDGDYRVDRYSHRFDDETNTFTGIVHLVRVKHGQRSMEEIMLVPKPSQMDDWKLYQNLIESLTSSDA